MKRRNKKESGKILIGTRIRCLKEGYLNYFEEKIETNILMIYYI